MPPRELKPPAAKRIEPPALARRRWTLAVGVAVRSLAPAAACSFVARRRSPAWEPQSSAFNRGRRFARALGSSLVLARPAELALARAGCGADGYASER